MNLRFARMVGNRDESPASWEASSKSPFCQLLLDGGDPGVGPIFVRERHLATVNATYFVSTFGMLGTVALVAAALQALLGRIEIQLRK